MNLLPLLLALTPLAATLEATAADEGQKIPVLLVTGANNHWWEWTAPALHEMLADSGKFEVLVTREPARTLADAELLSRFRAIVLDYNGPRWGAEAEQNFLQAVRGGTGVVVVHAANNAFPGWKEYEELVALLWRDGTGHGRFHPFDVTITDRDHPVTRDLPDLVAHPDELYHRLVHMHETDYRVLATAFSSEESGGTGRDEPMILVKSYGEGRIFHTPLGHVWKNVEPSKASFFDPQFQEVIVRGTEWAATGEVTPSRRPANTLTRAEEGAGWQLLFDGETGGGWRAFRREGFPEQGWRIEDGALHCVAGGGGGDLVSSEEYQDFELAFEWKVAPGANSGVMYRVTEDRGNTWETGPEYQVLDDSGHHDGQNTSTSAGALYALITAEPKLLRPVGEWNSGRIVVVGNHVEHWLNGRKVVSFELHSELWNELVAASKFSSMPGFGKSPRGRIALQDHGNDVWYRNLRVRRLDWDAARAQQLFDGRSLAGWTYHLNDGGKLEDVWSVTDEGVLVCKGNPIGYLRTEAVYDNFVLRVRWRFDPSSGAGNSGVLLRRIGPDKVWPRSIEAQLQSGAAGDFWNIDRFPMQVDPARTQGRNTRRTATNEKALGEWNEYEITLWQGHCVLRVNGQILNQAWGCMEIPGNLCLQSEGAEIHFGEVALVPLPARAPSRTGQ